MSKVKYAKYLATLKNYNNTNHSIKLQETNPDAKLKGSEHTTFNVSFNDNKYNLIHTIYESYKNICDIIEVDYNDYRYDMLNLINDMNQINTDIENNNGSNNQIYSIEVDNENNYYGDKFFNNDNNVSLSKTINNKLNEKYDTNAQQYIK